LIGVAIAGAVPFLAFTAFGVSQVYFGEEAVIALDLLSAAGLCELWSRARAARDRPLGRASGATVLLVTAVLAVVASYASATGRAALLDHVDIAIPVALGLVLVAVALRGGRDLGVALAAALALLLVGTIARPLNVFGSASLRVAAGAPLYSEYGRPLTRGLREALFWLRGHSPATAVVAVNNSSVTTLYDGRRIAVPAYYDYSAFGERPVFLEGWLYSQRAFELGEEAVFFHRENPFPDRARLDDAVFHDANAQALQTLVRRYGVRYLLVDHVHGWASPRVRRLGRRVFGNAAATIYRVGDRAAVPAVG
jgi:hypothetical protein